MLSLIFNYPFPPSYWPLQYVRVQVLGFLVLAAGICSCCEPWAVASLLWCISRPAAIQHMYSLHNCRGFMRAVQLRKQPCCWPLQLCFEYIVRLRIDPWQYSLLGCFPLAEVAQVAFTSMLLARAVSHGGLHAWKCIAGCYAVGRRSASGSASEHRRVALGLRFVSSVLRVHASHRSFIAGSGPLPWSCQALLPLARP